MEKEYITIKEAAQLTGKSESTLKRLAKKLSGQMSGQNERLSVQKIETVSGYKYLVNQRFIMNYYKVERSNERLSGQSERSNDRLNERLKRPQKKEVIEVPIKDLIAINKTLDGYKHENGFLKAQVNDKEKMIGNYEKQLNYLQAQNISLSNQNNELTHQLTEVSKKQLLLTEETTTKQASLPTNYLNIFLTVFFALLSILIIAFALFN